MPVTLNSDILAAVHDRVIEELRGRGVAHEVQADVELLTNEVVRYLLRDEAPDIDIEVSVDVVGWVTVIITSQGGHPPTALARVLGAASDTPGTRRGLDILDSLASVWGTRRQARNTTVWFTVRDAHGDDDAGDVSPHSGAVTGPLEMSIDASEWRPGLAVATEAELMVVQAAADAAATVAAAADDARTKRSAAVARAALSVADAAAITAAAVQRHHDRLAADAAAAHAVRSSEDAESEPPAVRLGAARTASSEDTARTAAIVARGVADAAAALAVTMAAEAAEMEQEVLDAAAAVQGVAAAVAQQLASDSLESGAAAARDASASSGRMQEANRRMARAGHHDRSVARALQDAMLTRLPESSELDLAARYLTADEDDQVGGDWYDAIVLPDGTTVLVIGDVIGHDIVAAATMGQLRNLLRAFVWDHEEPPSAVVATLDRAMRALGIDTMATMVLMRVEPTTPGTPGGGTTITWSNAGHPAPLLIGDDGIASVLDDTTDILLGITPDCARRDHTQRLPSGATVLLYTDGLIEVRGEDIDTGQQRLLDAAGRHHQVNPGPFLDAILTNVLQGRPTDDVAVLAARLRPPG